MMKMKVFSFDVETVGFSGPVFAVGYSVISLENGEVREIEAGKRSIGLDNASDIFSQPLDIGWLRSNVPEDVLAVSKEWENEPKSALVPLLKTFFIDAVTRHKDAIFVADCGSPCETRWLHEIQWFPYPLHELATMLLSRGMDPTGTYERKPNELPKHCPMADSRQSGRLFIEAWNAGNANDSRVAKLEKENADLQAMIDKVWDTIWRYYDIEERKFFEEEAPKTGNWSPLQMALHHIWKRDPKVAELERDIARLTLHSDNSRRKSEALHQIEGEKMEGDSEK